MSRLTCIAIHQTRLEKAFLQDNVQGYRVELHRALRVLDATYPETPVVDPETKLTRLDGPENWL
jgi:hypothetical protein